MTYRNDGSHIHALTAEQVMMGASQQYKNKMMGDHGSDAFARLNSEKRTGYQTGSDQPVDFS